MSNHKKNDFFIKALENLDKESAIKLIEKTGLSVKETNCSSFDCHLTKEKTVLLLVKNDLVVKAKYIF